MRKAAGFAASGAALIGACGWVMTLLFPGIAESRAIVVSGVLAFVVQMVSYAVARAVGPKNIIAGWGLGMVLRLVVLTVFALVVVRLMELPLASAIVSFAVFLFVTTVIEPLFLN